MPTQPPKRRVTRKRLRVVLLEKAEKLGGKTVVPPTEIPDFGLTFAFFADPEGHVVGLSRGAVQ